MLHCLSNHENMKTKGRVVWDLAFVKKALENAKFFFITFFWYERAKGACNWKH